MLALLGREREQAALDGVLAAARVGSSAAVVAWGEPGIGKTALLDWAAARARGAGMEVLGARGVESESEVPFAGLLELLRGTLGDLDRIPERQADALRGALGLALGPAPERDRFLIGAALLNLLSARSDRAPLAVVIDDAHWLDDPSLAAVLFAARRLLMDPVAVILAARTDEAPTVAAAGLAPLALTGVDAQAAVTIIGRHAPARAGPAEIDRITSSAAGNPLALVELAMTAGAAGPARAEEPLGLGSTAVGRYTGRLVELPATARRTLALAAAEETGHLAWIEAAARALDLDLADLELGERAGLLQVAFGALAWRHPLARSAAYQAVAPDERRAVHAALATVLPAAEPDRRAWHRAAAAFGADEPAAAALDGAAARARGRSAYATAATASERAARLSPDDADRARRLFAAAEAAWLGGQPARAEACLEQARDLEPEPRLRGEVDHLLGEITIRAGAVMDGHATLVARAEAIAPLDPSKAVVMLAEATDACVYAGRPAAMLGPARRAAELLPADAGARERFFVDLALGTALIYAGEGREGARLLKAAEARLEGSDILWGDPRLLSAAALAPLWLREGDRGRVLVDRAIDLARAEGALGTLPFALTLAGRDAVARGRWPLGRALFEEAIGLARETAQELPLAGALAGLALLHARTGSPEACREAAEEALILSERRGLGLFRLWALEALAELALAMGEPLEAGTRLRAKQAVLDELGLSDPDLSPVPDLVEALRRSGEGEDLERSLAAFAVAAERKAQPWALARLARARGVFGGDEDGFTRALRHHAGTPDAFEQGRTHLCYGEWLRRSGQRVRAREQLRAALGCFEALGARPWADRARRELLATGERARARDPSTLDDLTPQELQVGLVLTGGHTTREAAAKLFLSPKTVEYHLRNAYRKLGIHSREELARALDHQGGA